jgi:hypothetical protein
MNKKRINKVLKENVEYEKLYDEIQSVTNNINNFCGFSIMNNSISDEYAVKLMKQMQDLASKLSDTAHELEEHLAWD